MFRLIYIGHSGRSEESVLILRFFTPIIRDSE